MSNKSLLTDEECYKLIAELVVYFDESHVRTIFKQKGIGHLKDILRLWYSELDK